ncbi:trigger factor [Allosphingosinicella sp.]|jgi:trigger factor|uniref:trigger factor n=1 Tax=Allosphingosinicella sp. TaxID=2823234 RepID=UPI002F12B3EB
MNTVETLNEGLKRAYRLTIPAKDIDSRVDEELKSVASQVRMPGFRPGKVPANLIRKMHGARFEQQALESAIQDGVQRLLSENKLRPAMQPSVELEDHQPGKDAVVKVELETLPEVPEPKVDELRIERLTVEPSEAEIDEAVGRIASGQKGFDPAPASHKARMGDRAVIDYEGKVDGEAFEGGKGERMSVELGSGRLIPGFEEQLVGAKANEQRALEVRFPDDYNVDYLKGRDATFEVTVNEIQTPREIKADDDFAKSMGLEGIGQLRELIKGQLQQELGGLVRTHMKRQLLDELAARHDFPVPPSMVEAEFEQIWSQLEQEAAREPDPDSARADMEKEKADYRAIAERRVRLGLLLSDIGQKNGIEVSQQEMNQLVSQAAQQYKPEDRQRFADFVRENSMAAAQLRAPLYEDKVVDFLFSKAKVTERPATRDELQAAIEAEEDHVHGPGCGHDHGPGAKPKAAKKGKAADEPAKKAKKDEPAPADEAKTASAAKKPAAKKAKAKK